MRKIINVTSALCLSLMLMSLSPKEPIYVIEDEGFTCKEFAMSVGLLAEAYGGDYWVEYWNAYNWCVFEYPE